MAVNLCCAHRYKLYWKGGAPAAVKWAAAFAASHPAAAVYIEKFRNSYPACKM